MQELFDDIKTSSADIVLLGEIHDADGDFRRIVLELLSRLSELGYSVLALELTNEVSGAVAQYCAGTIDYHSLSSELAHARKENLGYRPRFSPELYNQVYTWLAPVPITLVLRNRASGFSATLS